MADQRLETRVPSWCGMQTEQVNLSGEATAFDLYAIELRTTRWEMMVAWYKQALGLRGLLRVEEDRYALLAAGNSRLAITGCPLPGDASARWCLAFEVPDLDLAQARLEGAGAEVGPRRLHPEGFTALTVNDPDGNRIRLFAWPEDAGR
jgi:predicted enzyme related to lactoylglutathione lyase